MCDEQLPAKATCEKRPCCLSRQVCLAPSLRIATPTTVNATSKDATPSLLVLPRPCVLLLFYSGLQRRARRHARLHARRQHDRPRRSIAKLTTCCSCAKAIKGSAANPLQAAAARSAARVSSSPPRNVDASSSSRAAGRVRRFCRAARLQRPLPLLPSRPRRPLAAAPVAALMPVLPSHLSRGKQKSLPRSWWRSRRRRRPSPRRPHRRLSRRRHSHRHR